MNNVIHFLLPDDAEMSDAELAAHMAGATGKLLAENTLLMVERDCFRSAWNWQTKRLEAKQVRCLRLVIAGALVGALVAWTLDGSLAQKVDHALRAVGL